MHVRTHQSTTPTCYSTDDDDRRVTTSHAHDRTPYRSPSGSFRFDQHFTRFSPSMRSTYTRNRRSRTETDRVSRFYLTRGRSRTGCDVETPCATSISRVRVRRISNTRCGEFVENLITEMFKILCYNHRQGFPDQKRAWS